MILAHRGSSACCPENTLEAFSLAVDQGADGIELDVHLSKDGEIVVAHDAMIDRVSDGKGHINDYTLDELKKFNFGKLFPGRSCSIPALKEVFSLIKPTSLSLNIELKCVDRIYNDLHVKLVNLAKEYSMEDRIIYSSFNHYYLKSIQRASPYSQIGLLYEMAMVDPWVYANYMNAQWINPYYKIIAAFPETVSRCHACGIKVSAWTLDDPDAINLMLKYNVDAVICERPDTALACRALYNQAD